MPDALASCSSLSYFRPRTRLLCQQVAHLRGGLVLVKEIYTALGMLRLMVSLLFLGYTTAMPLLRDDRAPFNLTNSDLNTSIGPFLM